MAKPPLRKPRRLRCLWLAMLWAVPLVATFVSAAVIDAGDRDWTPTEWRDIDTLEILTTGPEEGEHWSKLWLVEIDGELYIRLGSRAAQRVQRNTTAPYVSVRIAGKRFDRVRAEDVPEYRERVAEAMAEKYRSDLIIRFLPHPMVVRLSPETRVSRGSTERVTLLRVS